MATKNQDRLVAIHENRLNQKSGKYRDNLDRGQVFEWDEDGKPLRMIDTDTDISEQKQLQDQLRQAQEMEAVGQLTGDIAHDFNNILGLILGNLDLFKDKISGDEEVSKRVVTINEATRRAANLVKQLMGFSHPQATDIVLSNINRVTLNMDNLIKRSIITPR